MQFFGYCKQKSLFPEINILMSNVHKVAVYVEGSFHGLGIADTVDVNVAGMFFLELQSSVFLMSFWNVRRLCGYPAITTRNSDGTRYCTASSCTRAGVMAASVE